MSEVNKIHCNDLATLDLPIEEFMFKLIGINNVEGNVLPGMELVFLFATYVRSDLIQVPGFGNAGKALMGNTDSFEHDHCGVDEGPWDIGLDTPNYTTLSFKAAKARFTLTNGAKIISDGSTLVRFAPSTKLREVFDIYIMQLMESIVRRMSGNQHLGYSFIAEALAAHAK